MRDLYHDAYDVLGLDIGGDEFPRRYRGFAINAPAMTDAEFAAFINPTPRPAVTAYQGADLDAYWMDAGTWRHCQTGEAWKP